MKIKTYNILIVVASILVTLTSSFIIFTLIPINKNNTNINNNENTNTNNKENNNIIKEKELFIHFETEYNRFVIEDYSSNSTKNKFIDYYKCISNTCDYTINENIAVIYDNDKVIYKDLNKKDGFKESKSEKAITFYDNIHETNVTIEAHNILKNYYYIINGYKNNKYLYKPNGYVYRVEDKYEIIAFDKNTLEDGYVAIYFQGISIYDFKSEHIVFNDSSNVINRGLNFNKENDFYILSGAEDVMYDYIYTSNFELVTKQVYIFNNYDYYIKDNIIFYIVYIEDNKQLIVKDKNNKQIEYPSKNINPIRIRDSYLLYLDKDNTIKIKALSNNKVVVDSKLKFNKDDFYDFYIKSNNFIIEYVDTSLKTTDKWKECVKKYLKENEILSLDDTNEPGYLLEFNKNNELIRDEVKVLVYYDW